MPLIPIFTLIIGYIFKKKPLMMTLLLIGILPSLYLLLFPNPNQLLDSFYSKQKAGHYRETYRMLNDDTKAKINEVEWKVVNTTINAEQIRPVREAGQWKLLIKDRK